MQAPVETGFMITPSDNALVVMTAVDNNLTIQCLLLNWQASIEIVDLHTKQPVTSRSSLRRCQVSRRKGISSESTKIISITTSRMNVTCIPTHTYAPACADTQPIEKNSHASLPNPNLDGECVELIEPELTRENR